MKFYNPENFKQGQLLLNRYNPKEVVILFLGVLVTVVLVMVVGNFAIGSGNIPLLIILFLVSLLPAGASFFLMNPYAGYHNAFYYFKLKLTYKNMQKNYMWEGVQYDDSDE